jgi:hypothetical protein
MTGETLGGHIIRSLEKSKEQLEAATKKGKKEANQAADVLEAELDRLLALLQNKGE